MLKRNISEIKKELNKRGIKEIGKEGLSSWALVFVIEDLVKETKKPFMIKGVEILSEELDKNLKK
jgi:predicted naringenin-chalcone synthase